MANKLRKITAAVLCAAMMIGAMPFARAYDTIKADNSYVTPLTYSGAASLKVTNGTYTASDKTYTARTYALQAGSKSVSIGVANGEYIYGKNTVSDMVGKYDSNGRRIIGAINGDFFDTATGLPLGIQIDGGRIYATNSPYNSDGDIAKNRTSLGFKADGTVVFGVPELDISVTVDGYTVSVTRINTPPNYDGGWLPVTLITEDYNKKTLWTGGKAYDVIVLNIEDDISIGDDATCHFDKLLEDVTEPIAVEKGKAYVVAAPDFFAGFTPPEVTPDKPDISYISVRDESGDWENVVAAVGGGNMLIKDGKIVPPSSYDTSIKYAVTQRTAFGVKADGSYVFFISDISGMRMDAIAQAMFDIGCVNALNLDGGGSTTLLADEGDGLKLKNKPKDGSQRKISNAILIMSDETAPVVVDDLEAEKTFTEIFDGTNLVSARLEKQHVYTGDNALAIDYTLSGVGKTVGIDFEPIDIKNYNRLAVAVDMNKTKVTLEAKLKTSDGKTVTRPLTVNSENYSRAALSVADCDELIGFSLVYKEGGKHRSTVYIDRITGWNGFAFTDNTPPVLTVKTDGNKITATATKPVFTAPVDVTEIRINGGEAVRTGSVDISTSPSDKINRVRVDAVDVLGNRSAKYSLFKTAKYSAAMPFSDVTDGKWDSLFIRYCYENGIINGYPEGDKLMYKGSQNVTRAQFCIMVVSQKKLNLNDYLNVKLPYEDIADIPSWALPYVRAAYAEGIMTGTTTATGVVFKPNNDITRAEAASALDRLMTKDTRLITKVTYKDESDIAKWAKTAVAEVSTQGLFEGDKDGKFYPSRSLTRSESAVLMSKL